MIDTIIISDTHLGSPLCQHKKLLKFLEECTAKRILINGDFLDCSETKRLNRHHWKILSEIRRLSDHCEIIWVAGNHDEGAEYIANLLGVRFISSPYYIFEVAERKIFVSHGHYYDDFVIKYPKITWLADYFYRTIQSLHLGFALRLKKNSKAFLRNAEEIKLKAAKESANHDIAVATCGHSHHPEDSYVDLGWNESVRYINSGCWTESECSYIELHDTGKIELRWL